MVDQELSLAVVTWTGWGTASFPVREDDLLVGAFGSDKAIELLPRVHGVEEDFYRSNANLTTPDLQSMGELAAIEFRSTHPEVSEEAVKALAWCYTYDFK